ncbi:hypothetical protein K493DRAFT_341813 [Basidiobolus meristosporus CBS 931.73]|uniref:Uncharacterized protein n=1 Tax=Basidiobolus meristosporus CBS 931.73 TaxID=1314790 RepID=A0A1Y1XHR0_9FUNG|nr:hypothetical protein K493DRAFT_341813 [Basidiobolus meristosporus CBS 931.73]|eukprot:ORX85301.1 hypothetical protein K493DRAFT_341813 [Basidiobolus meristosporus CBS 931.73]
MWVRPGLVGSSLGRKNLRTSTNFVLQAIDPQRNTKAPYFYRIITKNFPHYKVAEGDNYEEMQENFTYLNEILLPSIAEKKTSKNIAKWLRVWYEENYSILATNGNRDSLVGGDSTEDESSDISQHSNPGEPVLDRANPIFTSEPVPSCLTTEAQIADPVNTRRPSITAPESLESPIDGEGDTSLLQIQAQENDPPANEQANDERLGPDNPESVHSESLSSESTHSENKLTEDLEPSVHDNWWSSQGLGVLSNWFDSPAAVKKNNQNIGIWEIPIQLIALLTYPVTDAHPGKNPSYAELRAISQVTQRRKILLFLTLYVFVIRYASFDLFLLLLCATQCAMLFLMKNSAKVNMQMAKRTVRQRVNWAKQWAGGFFRKSSPPNQAPTQPRPSNIVLYPNKQSPTGSPTESPSASQPDPQMKSQKRFFSRTRNNTAPDLSTNFVANENSSPAPTAKQRRRFFSKSKGFNSNLPPTIEASDIEPDGRKSLESP